MTRDAGCSSLKCRSSPTSALLSRPASGLAVSRTDFPRDFAATCRAESELTSVYHPEKSSSFLYWIAISYNPSSISFLTVRGLASPLGLRVRLSATTPEGDEESNRTPTLLWASSRPRAPTPSSPQSPLFSRLRLRLSGSQGTP